MDVDSIRTSHIGQGTVPHKRETLYRSSAQPKVAPVHTGSHTSRSHTPTHETTSQTNKLSLFRVFVLALLVLIFLSAVAIGSWTVYSSRRNHAAAVLFDNQKYQAVFLAGGQVYFGKLQMVDNQYIKLSNVFYIKSDSTDTKDTTGDKSNMQLIKLGDEVHGPDDSMTINRDQVLFFEDLKSDSKVTQLINQYKQGK